MTSTPSLPFDGDRILITGSTRGIGRGIARRLLAGGAVVGLHGRDPEAVECVALELHDATGSDRTVPLSADLCEPGAGKDLVNASVETAGRIDGLVNNAGGGRAQPFRGLNIPLKRMGTPADVAAHRSIHFGLDVFVFGRGDAKEFSP